MLMQFYPAPPIITWEIVGLSAAILALFVLGTYVASQNVGREPRSVMRNTAVAAFAGFAWIAATGFIAGTGGLADFNAKPPPFAIFFVVLIVCAIGLGLSRVGLLFAQGLPLWALVGFQAFRLPLEFALREAGRVGLAPVQLTMSGFNYDVVTGVTALLLAYLLLQNKVGKHLVFAWNVMGVGFLVVIGAIAVATAPFVHAFGDKSLNTWVMHLPFVWLPAVLVFAAIFGHVVVFRKLARQIN